jgi:phytoene dehydrogenase-like protein
MADPSAVKRGDASHWDVIVIGFGIGGLSQALRPRTPVEGLHLGGQDAGTPGVIGAAMGGLMAAASIEPSLWTLLR